MSSTKSEMHLGKGGLHIYSISQLWFVVWKVIKDAASYASHRFSSRTKASATIPSKIRKQIEKAVQEDGIGRSCNRPDGHLAGSLGDVFSSTFNIAEETDGRLAFQKFALLNPSNMEQDDDLEYMAALFMRRALENQNAGSSMAMVAEAIRAGEDTRTAVESVMKANQN